MTERARRKGSSARAKESLVTRKEAAAALDVEPNRISKWVADGAPVAARGDRRGHSSLYSIADLRKWLSGRASPADEAMSLAAARARLAQAQAEKWERENRVRSGELLERAQVVSEGRMVTSALRAKFLGLSRLAVYRGIVSREKESELRDVVVEALRELTRWSVEDSAA